MAEKMLNRRHRHVGSFFHLFFGFPTLQSVHRNREASIYEFMVLVERKFRVFFLGAVS